jgi:hypothetical protein
MLGSLFCSTQNEPKAGGRQVSAGDGVNRSGSPGTRFSAPVYGRFTRGFNTPGLIIRFQLRPSSSLATGRCLL